MTSYRKPLVGGLLALILTLPVCVAQDGDGDGDDGPAAAGEAVAAYLGDQAITVAEIDATIGGELTKIRQEEFDARRKALDRMVVTRMLEQEAAQRGISIEELLKAEVQEKAAAPSDEMMRQMYEQNKTHPSLQGKTYEDVKPLIERTARGQMMEQRRQEYTASLLAKSGLRVALDPPRVDVQVPAGEPTIGPEGAPVTIVEFADFQCGYCKRSQPDVEKLLAEYGDKVRFVYRDYALDFHKRAEPAAIAARCAGDQDKYWEYHGSLMKVNGTLDDDDLKKRAETLGLDMAAFVGCYESGRHREAVQAGFQDGSMVGVTGTPTFFINGRMLVGAKPLEELKAVVDDELRRASAKTGT